MKLTLLDNFWNNESSVSFVTIKPTVFVISFSLTKSVTGLLKKFGNKRDRTVIVELNAFNKPDLFVPRNTINF